MTMDPKEIEGSPERAADRGREEDLGLVVGSKPSLGNPDVVRGLVSEFATQVVAARKSFNEGALSGDQAQSRVHDLAVEYGAVVMGRNQDYDTLPWNDPARLGRRIRLVLPEVDGVEDPGEQLFLSVGASLIEIAVAHEEGRMPDADAEQKAKVMLEDTADLILGVR